MGYAGGSTARPTYHDLGGHAEAVQIDFDPEKISYNEILDLYFAGHRPTRLAWSSQYRSAIFFADEDQRRQAQEHVKKLGERLDAEIFVDILSADSFYRAEDYHQKFYLQRCSQVMDDLYGFYPDFRDLVGSTAAARLNGYLGGSRTHELRRADLDQLGLSEAGQRVLQKEARRIS